MFKRKKNRNTMLTLELMGGLGNQLFQLAFLDYISQLTNSQPFLYQYGHITHHSNVNYLDTIFSEWKHLYKQLPIHEVIRENEPYIVKSGLNAKFIGYFQNYKYILPNFISKLTFDNSILLNYPDICNSIFIHIRGGDYLDSNYSWLHNTTTDTYYQNAVSLFPNANFVVFTNDIEYVKTKPFLNDYPTISENEVDSLLLMSKCAGGICANSTFSWWGAYLNPTRQLILPSKWFNDSSDTSGYYFQGCTIVDV